jgi:hypothetical protein
MSRYSLSSQVGIDTVTQGYTCHRHARLQALLDDLGVEGFGKRSFLAHGNHDRVIGAGNFTCLGCRRFLHSEMTSRVRHAVIKGFLMQLKAPGWVWVIEVH